MTLEVLCFKQDSCPIEKSKNNHEDFVVKGFPQSSDNQVTLKFKETTLFRPYMTQFVLVCPQKEEDGVGVGKFLNRSLFITVLERNRMKRMSLITLS